MDKRFVAVRDQVVADRFGEETFLVNFRNGRYYAMRGAAGMLWDCLQTPQSAATILSAWGAGSSAGIPEEAASDLSSFLEKLVAEGLLEEAEEVDSDGSQAGAPILAADYQAPVLEVFDDLSELITIDPVHEVDNERGWPVQPK